MASMAFVVADMASAQNEPTKPIRVITAQAGGSNDMALRLVARELTVNMGQQVIVDNRGGGLIPGEFAASSAPDGFTLLFYGSALWLLPLMRDNVPWDAMKDFSPITSIVSYPLLLLVHPSLPVKSIKDLIALAKAKPGVLNYASGSAGAAAHLTMELFKAVTRTDITRISYRGAAPAMNALVGGEVQVSFPATASGMPHVKSGRLRALGVSSSHPSLLAPGVPTVAASLPGFESSAIVGMFAPPKTAPTIVTRLNHEIARVLAKGDLKEKMLSAGMETAAGSPDELVNAMKSEVARFSKVIKDAGIRAE